MNKKTSVTFEIDAAAWAKFTAIYGNEAREKIALVITGFLAAIGK